MKKKVAQHLKALGFLTIWFTIPVVILVFFLSPANQLLPGVYQTQTVPAPSVSPIPGGIDIFFKVLMKGVTGKNLANQPIFIKAVGQDERQITFTSLSVWQDENNPGIWRGTLNFPQELLSYPQEASPSVNPKTYTFYIKGPVHLQRKFENIEVVRGQELDFTDKLLLPGDVVLPDTGQDDKVDILDRDYLWSLVAKDGRVPTGEEIRAADLDLDGQITSRDYSLLIDTGIGAVGEK